MHTVPDNLLIFIDGKNKTSEIKRFDISKYNVRFMFSLNNKVKKRNLFIYKKRFIWYYLDIVVV